VIICYVRGELTAEQVEPLHTQLLQLVSNFAAGPRIVLTRLCIAVSDVVDSLHHYFIVDIDSSVA